MGKSALYALRNATATFLVAGTGTVTDSRTGNVTAVTEELEYSLYVQGEVEPNISRLPGADGYSRQLICNAVSPSVLDSRVMAGTKCKITFSNAQESDGIVKDTYVEYGRTGLIANALSKALGDSLIIEQNWRS